jgi:ABC-type transport system involved in multi-copper enzyme maturation permease subunit
VKRLLSAELLKLRTTRTFYALAGVAIGLSMLLTILVAILEEPSQQSVLSDVFTNDLSSIFIMILGIVGITGEWRHRTITSSLLAAPDRLRFLTAKLLAFAAAGALLSIGISIATAIVGYAILSIRDLPTPELGQWLEQVGRTAVVAALLGPFGVALGSLIRNQPTAIVAVLILGFVIEPTLIALVPDVGRWGTGVLTTSIQGIDPEDAGIAETDPPSAGAAFAAMLVWIAVPFAAGAALLRARDVE